MSQTITLQSDSDRDLRCIFTGTPSHDELETTFAAVMQMFAEGDSDSLDLVLDLQALANRDGDAANQ